MFSDETWLLYFSVISEDAAAEHMGKGRTALWLRI